MPERAGPRAGHRGGAQLLPSLRVAVVGRGLLASAIREVLGAVPCPGHVRACHVVGMSDLSNLADLARDGDGSPEGRLLVTASDGWDCREYERIQALCAAHRTSWLPVRTELGQTVIGPSYTPGAVGCVSCAELRRSLADDHYPVRQLVRERYPRLADQPSPWLTALTARTVAAVTADEVIGAGPSRSGRTRCALLYVDLGTLAVSTHRFLPDPLCPVCGALPDDSPAAARIALRPRPKPAPGTYRVRRLGDADLVRLRETYVDEETGLIRRTETFASGSLAVGAAAMRTRAQARAELSWGRTLRYRTSETVALLEALERYGGMTPGGRRSVVHASFDEVRDSAVDPRTLGLYPPERYARPGFPFQPFDTGRPCRWVWGYSLARREPVLIPQAYAYYAAHRAHPDDPSFAFEISNGCALGSCLEEAILYGLLEVVERDAFLLTWYARLPAARIDLSTARDPSVPMLARAIEADTGYRVLAFDATMEHGIPSVWAMAVGPAGAGQPALACSAGAHLDPERAASGALCELGPILSDLIGRYPEIAERGRAMARDASLVVTMDDHAVLYANQAASSRLDFLTASAQSRSFADVRSRHATADAFQSTDLTDDLTEMVRRLWRHGLDVIAVDQTTPEHRAGGFCCVKVIVPGALPMTFGHDNRRVLGLPRLQEVPRLLGYRHQAPAAAGSQPASPPLPVTRFPAPGRTRARGRRRRADPRRHLARLAARKLPAPVGDRGPPRGFRDRHAVCDGVRLPSGHVDPRSRGRFAAGDPRLRAPAQSFRRRSMGLVPASSQRHQAAEGEAETAESGRQALDRLERAGGAPFDVVLLDIEMPELDGYETLSRIKENEGLRHTPVIMISGVDELDSIVRCIEMGATDYLPKPFDVAILRARLNASLAEKRLRQELRELRIEIDEQRQARKVAEITGTEYFRNLRDRAKDLRKIIED